VEKHERFCKKKEESDDLLVPMILCDEKEAGPYEKISEHACHRGADKTYHKLRAKYLSQSPPNT
jgi:hypothetical protein